MADERKPQVPGGQPPKPQEDRPIQHGDFEKREAPLGERVTYPFAPEDGEEK